MTRVYHDGRFTSGPVTLAADDAGFLYGDGLFETLRAEDGRARDVPAHLDRLETGLRRIGLGIPETRAELAEILADVAAAAPRPLARLRLTVTRGSPGRGPTRLATATPWEPPPPESYTRGVAVLLCPDLRLDSQSPLAGLKTLSCQLQRLASLRAAAAGVFEALLVNEHGRAVEGSRSNLVASLSDGLFTPPEREGCLPGTVRRRLLESGIVRECPLTPHQLADAEALWLTNSLIGILPVGWLDGRALPVTTGAVLPPILGLEHEKGGSLRSP